MRIGGFQKLTLIDYPGKIATTVFTVGCSFRCPFCHNPELVLGPQFPAENGQTAEFFSFLKKRQGKLEGVCITGGEPTIQPGILEFMQKIKKLGFVVKLDSNGTRPDILAKAFKLKLVDFVAMDIKSAPEKYALATGGAVDLERIKLSVELIKNSGVSYEFRTTVVPGIHEEADFLQIGQWLKGSQIYFLQPYREFRILDPKLKQLSAGKSLDLQKIKQKIQPYFGQVAIREL